MQSRAKSHRQRSGYLRSASAWTMPLDDLEKAYVDREVQSHQAMLATIDGELIPAARDRELQRRLGDLRSEVAAHLQAAENVKHAEWSRRTAQQQRADIGKTIGNDYP